VDVTIRKAAIHCEKREEDLAKDGDALVLTIPEVATYRIANGDEILVDAAPDVPDRNVRLFLLGSAFGALLHQRGLLPLHANAIEIDGKAIAFMGESGAGKSTLAAWFHDHGYRVIADDVCVVRFDSGAAQACVGLPRVRLWRGALEASGRDPQAYARSFIGDDEYEKFDVPLPRGASGTTTLPLGAIYLLERAAEFKLLPLSGVDAAEATFAHTYRGGFVSSAANATSHWEQCLKLVRQVPMFRCERVWGVGRLGEQCAAILHHLSQVASVHTHG
jgi:hypothetical protein